ncbi:MAG TPA: hypothetical protein VJV76_05045 [Gaiellaceae bacterium]|nr:hypothetical protein [Gaiellaceae bacterium]
MRTPAAVLAALAALAAGCGNGGAASKPSGTSVRVNTEALKPSARVFADAKVAALGARSVHLTAHVSSGEGPIAVSLTLVGSSAAEGTITYKGFPFRIVRKGRVLYFRATDAFWRHQGGSRAVRLLHGRWIKAAQTTPGFRKFPQFTDMTAFLARIFRKKPRPTELGNAGVKSYRHQRVVALYGSGSESGDSFYVAAVGKPYPLAILGKTKDGQSFAVRFSDWNRPASIRPPKDALDLSKLKTSTVVRA